MRRIIPALAVLAGLVAFAAMAAGQEMATPAPDKVLYPARTRNHGDFYIDVAGREVVHGIRDPQPFSEGVGVARDAQGRCVLYDGEGKLLGTVDGKVASTGPCREGLILAWTGDGVFGFLDRKGQWAMPPRKGSARSFADGLAPCEAEDGKWGYIDKAGKFAIAPQYRGATRFSEGLALVCADAGWVYIDKAGKEVLKATWVHPDEKPTGADGQYAFSHGRAPGFRGGRWGFVDKTGRWAVEPKYLTLRPFHEGLAVVAVGPFTREQKEGYVDVNGKEVIPPTYLGADDFMGGGALVYGLDQRARLIDKTGKEIWRAPAEVSVSRTHDGVLYFGSRYTRFRTASCYYDRNLKLVWEEPAGP